MIDEADQKYRKIIDELVEVCKNGQGKVASNRVLAGIWNRNARKDLFEDQHEINLLLGKLNPKNRETLASMLGHEMQTGVFETLKVLEKEGVQYFERGYEGSPYHDFIGRMADWEWPERQR